MTCLDSRNDYMLMVKSILKQHCPERNRWARSFFVFNLIALVCLVTGCAHLHFGPLMEPLEEKVLSGDGADKILILDVEGVISNQAKKSMTGFQVEIGMIEKVREILSRAEKDKAIKALMVRINSPGGTVTSSDIIHHELKKFKERNNVKIYASIIDLAASGGYYIAVAGDKIIAHPTSLSGSIGVIAMIVNLEELFNKVGVDWEIVKSAEKKDFLSPFRALTKEERVLFQETIDSFHNRFVQIVADNRKELNIPSVKELADGRIFTAQEARDNKLIDEIGYLDDVISLIKKDLQLSNPRIVMYHRPGQYKTNMYSSLPGSPIINFLNINLGLDMMGGAGPRFMYLWLP